MPLNQGYLQAVNLTLIPTVGLAYIGIVVRSHLLTASKRAII